MKDDIFIVQENGALLEFLFEQFKDSKSKTTIKSYLAHRQVSVNGCVTTKFDRPIKISDKVVVSYGRQKETLRHPMLRIVFEDEYLLVVEKRNGLLSIATDKQPTRTAYNILSEYLKREDPAALIFVVHRLDRETSGLMMFSKNQELKKNIQYTWDEVVLERKYYAVTEGVIEQSQGVIETYLTESKALKVYATSKAEGKLAQTAFKVLKSSKTHTLLELQLQTGRKNQIRAHLEFVGHPIIGDKKYGAQTNPLGRVALHAGSLSFIHPVTGQRMDFSTPIPISFTKLFK